MIVPVGATVSTVLRPDASGLFHRATRVLSGTGRALAAADAVPARARPSVRKARTFMAPGTVQNARRVGRPLSTLKFDRGRWLPGWSWPRALNPLGHRRGLRGAG